MKKQSYEAFKALLTYDPLTGIIKWTKSGKLAGWDNGNGYRRITINGRPYYAHRVAWLLHYGEWPAQFIDHRDGNPINNAIANLREATASQNNTNSNRASRGGLPRGVNISRGRFRAIITQDRKRRNLGTFPTAALAHAAYLVAAQEIHGDFSVFSRGQ